MYYKEIKRKWLVDISKIPNIQENDKITIKYGYLSQEYDSLSVRVENGMDGEFYLTIKDNGLKSRNVVNYKISKDEYDLSLLLSGNKIIIKDRYFIKSSYSDDNLIKVDIYHKDGLSIAEFSGVNELIVDTLPSEEWFIREVTDNELFYDNRIIYN